jgi:pimeloyl-ACP methyl ester carboxylesterase
VSSDLLKPGWSSRYERVGEVRLHLVEAGPEGAPAVILLHGFPEFWWAWRHQIEPLVRAGFRVVAPDLRGYNLSEAPGGTSAYQADRLAEDVIGLADALGLARFSLVGHDWGGLVAWRVAAHHPARLERLAILDAPHPEVLAGFVVRHPTQALRSSYIAWFQLPVLPEGVLRAGDYAALRTALRSSARTGVFDDATLDRYAETWRQPGRLTAMLNYYRALRQSAGEVGRIAVPTLVLWGARDQALDSRLASESSAMAADGKVVILPEATHWLHLEEPERVAEELRSFLQA